MKKLMMAVAALLAVLALGACNTGGDASQSRQQATTEAYSQQLTTAEPYPLAQMTDSTERAQLREKLLRFNNPDKIGYVYEFSQTGTLIATFTIKGKVSSSNSQLSNTQNLDSCPGNGDACGAVVDSMGDDGSYGPNENGVFFFTTAGVMVEISDQFLWQYSDAPLDLTSKPVVVLNDNAKPSSTAGALK